MEIRILSFNNLLDGTTVAGISIGALASINWSVLIGILIGAGTLVMRYLAWREDKRANDLKELELSKKKRG